MEYGGDCDDSDPAVFPGASEVCDGVDNDCDGLIDDSDDDVLDPSTWYPDNDGDGFGDDYGSVEACDAPDSTWVADGGDCDDDDYSVYPGALERCDEIDNDCDGLVDEEDPDVYDAVTWYQDNDDDSFGTDASATQYCFGPPDATWEQQGGDCDDNAGHIWPGAQEWCDNLDEDEDCDGLAEDDDPDSLQKTDWWIDDDGDGYGDEDDMNPEQRCDGQGNQQDNNDDCDDADHNINPNEAEVCDPQDVDENCNMLADNNDPTLVDGTDYYPDVDGDTYGDANDPTNACEAPPGHVEDDQDCNDSNPQIHPGATEVCDGVDNDCDQQVDDDDPGVTGRSWWGQDRDHDGYPDHLDAEPKCIPVAPRTINIALWAHDCADLHPQINPGMPELCNGIDEDCDFAVDEDFDLDLDGWATCFGDCDDGDEAAHPEAEEVCDDVDNDCDLDLALDGCFGDAPASIACGDGQVQTAFGAELPACTGGTVTLAQADLPADGSFRSGANVTLTGAWDLGGADASIQSGCDLRVQGSVTGAGTLVLGAGEDVIVQGEVQADVAVLRAAERVLIKASAWIQADHLEVEAPTAQIYGDVDSGALGCMEGGVVHQRADSVWTSTGALHLDGTDVIVRGLLSGVDVATVVTADDFILQTTGELQGFGEVLLVVGDRAVLKGLSSDLGSVVLGADSMLFDRYALIEQVDSLDVDLVGNLNSPWKGDVVDSGAVSLSAASLRLQGPASFAGNGAIAIDNSGYLVLAADFVDNASIAIDTATWKLTSAASFTGNGPCEVVGTQLNGRPLVGCTAVP